MKRGWQQEEDFQTPSDGMASENEMSLVSMAANETVLCIHIRECRHKDVEDKHTDRNMEEGGKEGA